jgi:hypothetical protein
MIMRSSSLIMFVKISRIIFLRYYILNFYYLMVYFLLRSWVDNIKLDLKRDTRRMGW